MGGLRSHMAGEKGGCAHATHHKVHAQRIAALGGRIGIRNNALRDCNGGARDAALQRAKANEGVHCGRKDAAHGGCNVEHKGQGQGRAAPVRV